MENKEEPKKPIPGKDFRIVPENQGLWEDVIRSCEGAIKSANNSIKIQEVMLKAAKHELLKAKRSNT